MKWSPKGEQKNGLERPPLRKEWKGLESEGVKPMQRRESNSTNQGDCAGQAILFGEGSRFREVKGFI